MYGMHLTAQTDDYGYSPSDTISLLYDIIQNYANNMLHLFLTCKRQGIMWNISVNTEYNSRNCHSLKKCKSVCGVNTYFNLHDKTVHFQVYWNDMLKKCSNNLVTAYNLCYVKWQTWSLRHLSQRDMKRSKKNCWIHVLNKKYFVLWQHVTI